MMGVSLRQYFEKNASLIATVADTRHIGISLA